MLRKIFMVISIIVACQSQTIDPDLLREIFNTNFENITVTPTTGPSTYTQDDGSSCICVPYYLCDPDTNTTFTDGSLDGFGKIDIRFKPESCQESLEVCCKEPRDSSNPIIPEEKPERLRGCGVRNDKGVDFQISGSSGREAEFGEFPWTVALLYTSNGSSLCGGALIHPQVVLTGSHCVNKRRPIDFKIRAGEWDTQTTKERLPHQERNIRKIITHPQFHSQTLANNVALVILSEPVTLADNINTVCLPEQDQNFDAAKGCFATGWGKDYFGKAGRYAVIMKKVQLDAVDYATCQRQLQVTRLGSRFKLHRSFLCAGGQKGKDTCEGDGGAPLVCPSYSPGRYYQAGIVSWGVGCGSENVPAAYTYVSKYRTWIDGNMQTEGFDPSSYVLVD